MDETRPPQRLDLLLLGYLRREFSRAPTTGHKGSSPGSLSCSGVTLQLVGETPKGEAWAPPIRPHAAYKAVVGSAARSRGHISVAVLELGSSREQPKVRACRSSLRACIVWMWGASRSWAAARSDGRRGVRRACGDETHRPSRGSPLPQASWTLTGRLVEVPSYVLDWVGSQLGLFLRASGRRPSWAKVRPALGPSRDRHAIVRTASTWRFR